MVITLLAAVMFWDVSRDSVHLFGVCARQQLGEVAGLSGVPLSPRAAASLGSGVADTISSCWSQAAVREGTQRAGVAGFWAVYVSMLGFGFWRSTAQDPWETDGPAGEAASDDSRGRRRL